MARATTIRLTDEVFARLDQASARTGMPVNSIVIAACLEWIDRHTLAEAQSDTSATPAAFLMSRPRWATIRRAVKLAVAERVASPFYPFERFTTTAQKMLTAAQDEASKSAFTYIGTEHLLLAGFADGKSHSAVILASLGVRENAVRTTLDKILRGKMPPPNPDIIPTSRVKRVIELAFKQCSAAGDPSVSTAHILLGLASEGKGIAARILRDMGATAEQINAAREALTESEP